MALVLAAAYRDKLGGDHIDDARAALAAYEERIGWRRASGRRLRPRGIHGGRQVDRRPRAGGRPRRRAARLRPGARSSASAEPIESFFDREGEPAFRAREEQVVLELLERPRRARDRARRRSARLGARARRACAGHTVVHLEVEPEEPWRRASNHGRPLARDRDRFAALHSRPRRHLRVDGGRDRPPGEREGIRRVLPAPARRSPRRRRGRGSSWALRGLG